ncbi:MAG: hypothetical protein SOY60_05015 [Fusobacterium gastrosuis]|uniref:hypothetical protein n=1 Tax=Fusobacterium gastrosuis TaxID=1755100 RepID=UPI00297AF436|nr:hypothetical protein [Fusobacteriaceae bacterium]MDY4011006.1 hypothetical protein [Fusobacterium gastrosuis]MDY5713542.1 hypothetical protein [Fusobacterium gastrosuis]
MGIEERFTSLLNSRKEEKLEENNKTDKAIVDYKKYDKYLDFTGVIEISENRDLQEFLKQKTREIISIQADDAIKLGEILFEVEKELSRKGSPEANYLKFLDYNGINSKTALRLRKRYELYTLAPEHSKLIISLLSVREIEELYKNKDLLKELNPGVKLIEVKELLKENETEKIENKEKTEEIRTITDFKFLKSSCQDKFESLSEDNQDKVLELLKKIEKIFEKN